MNRDLVREGQENNQESVQNEVHLIGAGQSPSNFSKSLKVLEGGTSPKEMDRRRHEAEEDGNMETNIECVGRDGDLTPRHTDGLRSGTTKVKTLYHFKLIQGVVRKRALILLNDRQTILLEHKISQNSKSF